MKKIAIVASLDRKWNNALISCWYLRIFGITKI